MTRILPGIVVVLFVLVDVSVAESAQKDAAGTQLLSAVNKEDISTARALIKAGANISCRCGRNGVSPLELASARGNLELVKLILDSGADINQKNDLGITALHASIVKNRIDVFRYLRSRGARLSISGKGLTPIMLAAAAGSNDLVEILLGEREDINRPQPDGWTPLMHAAFFGHLETVKLLVAKGASVKAVTKDQKTAASIASEQGHNHIAAYLKDITN